MTDTTLADPRLAPGSNAPPLLELLAEEATALAKRRDDLLAAVARAPEKIKDEEMSGKVADLVRLIGTCAKAAEAMREDRKAPFLEGGSTVDSFFHKQFHVKGAKRPTAPLDIAKDALERRLTDYQRDKADKERKRLAALAEEQRLEAEQKKQAAEAAAAAIETEADLGAAISRETSAKQAEGDAIQAARLADAKPAELSRSRGDYGAVASLHTFWDFADLSRDEIDLEKLRTFIPVDALEKSVRAYIKANFTSDNPGEQIRGVRIFQNSETRVR